MGYRGRTVPLRAALAAFVVAWIFDVAGLRASVPVWLPFLIALGLEVQFFLLGIRAAPAGPPTPRTRLPQDVDRERYGYEGDELLLVRRDGEELWVPYSGEDEEELESLIERERTAREERAAAAAEPRRRPVRQLLAGVGVIAALAAVVWLADARSGWRGLDRSERDAATTRFSAEAARIAGHEVTIHCDEAGDYVGAVQHADGVATVGGDLAYLTPERCFDLYRLAFRGETTFSRTARAIAVLAHEAWHLQGVRDEGTTECYALQSGVELGRRLGLSERTARQMMRQQLAENTLHGGRSAEYVVPRECRDGGSLDLAPASSEFP